MENKREVGFVKWYGGFNYKTNRENKFGFIQRVEVDEDLFVHEKNLLCGPKSLTEDTVVIFQVNTNKHTGKKEAMNVKLYDDSNMEEVKLCLQTDHSTIWKLGLMALIGQEKLEEEMINIMIEKMEQLDSKEREDSVSLIPDRVLYDEKGLRKYLDLKKHLHILLELLQNSENEQEKESLYEEITISLKEKRDQLQTIPEQLWDKLFHNHVSFEGIRKDLPARQKIKFLTRKFFDGEKDKDLIKELVESFKIENDPTLIPDDLKKEAMIFVELKPDIQVETAWEYLQNYWDLMSQEAKILSIYKAVQENDFHHSFTNSKIEKDEGVKIILFLLENAKTMPHYELVHAFNDKMISYINKRAMETNDLLNLYPILPNCPVESAGVVHCEAKRWKKNGKWLENDAGYELAFCPRLFFTCAIEKNSDDKSARFHPIPHSSWKSWTLVELFDQLNIKPESYLPMNSQERYALSLGGWVNRLNDIRKRLKCIQCKETLIPNKFYSKDFARYNITVADCPNCPDQSVYLNHCWNCGGLIDSRESKLKYNNYYICIHCGSGPKPANQQSPLLRQGSICPKCGTEDMVESTNKKEVFHCKQCDHKIHLRGKVKYDFITPLLNEKDETKMVDEKIEFETPF